MCEDLNEPSEVEEFFLTREARENLKLAAQGATPGPWLIWDDGDVGTAYPVEVTARGATKTVESLWVSNSHHPENVFMAAADPSTVLALIAQIEQLEARLKDASSTVTF